MSDPFLITGPAVISFSGGRTSGYMLKRIIDAHGGALPPNVVVCFANTGREMPATLDFVRDCGAAWNVPVHWLEYRWQEGTHSFERVSHNSASRAGEPFEHVLRSRKMLPNPTMRFCTVDLKIRTMRRFIKSEFGWKRWTQAVGLRADERGRVETATDATKQRRRAEPGWVVCPLAVAGIVHADVMAFWARQTFDLRLAGKWEGNCDGCFLKSRAAIMRMHRDHPDRMEWWARMEAEKAGKTRKRSVAMFRADREPYAELARVTAATPMLPLDETMIEGGEACGMWCGV